MAAACRPVQSKPTIVKPAAKIKRPTKMCLLEGLGYRIARFVRAPGRGPRRGYFKIVACNDPQVKVADHHMHPWYTCREGRDRGLSFPNYVIPPKGAGRGVPGS